MPSKRLTLQEVRAVLYMNRGEYTKLAVNVGVSKGYVSQILNGQWPRTSDPSRGQDVLKAAHARAAELIAQKKTGRSNNAA